MQISQQKCQLSWSRLTSFIAQMFHSKVWLHKVFIPFHSNFLLIVKSKYISFLIIGNLGDTVHLVFHPPLLLLDFFYELILLTLCGESLPPQHSSFFSNTKPLFFMFIVKQERKALTFTLADFPHFFKKMALSISHFARCLQFITVHLWIRIIIVNQHIPRIVVQGL